MAKLTPGNKKRIATAGIASAGWHAITMYFTNLPSIPFVNNMVLAAAGVATLWAGWMLWNDF